MLRRGPRTTFVSGTNSFANVDFREGAIVPLASATFQAEWIN
jgi:hypothetical protein